MNIIEQIQITLDEINTLFEQIKKQPDQVKSIEIDLLKYKIVQLYDTAISLPAHLDTLQNQKVDVPAISFVKEQQASEKDDNKEEIQTKEIEVEVNKVQENAQAIEPEVKAREIQIEDKLEEAEITIDKTEEIPAVTEKHTEKTNEVVEDTKQEEVEELIVEKKELKQEFKADLFEDAQEQIKKKTVHEKFATKETSINEQIANSKSTGSVGENMQKGKITDIKSAISLNLKLSIIKDLYLGDQKEYKKMIDFFGKCKNYSEAKMFLTNEKDNRKHWANKPELVDTLMDLINRRFRLD
ncbi:MAG: hypothetical protein HN921_17440 [Bacteroidetes bacterium]|nr:hypothetical protein [Bacteroidota bacterium]MBT3934365.1 hypothetical protein [Bacteroidota bacterium]MBT4729504.1 hypothetical protein [Bacteroidota bacterium]MBT5989349.1 hypothetical protein [Bacteroidota bacterium]MBT7041618.1 hypothetical protein [Bacteroidota bacterium]